MAVTTTKLPNTAIGIPYSVTTDSSSDWPSVSNEVYFFDKATDLPYYKNSSGTVVKVFEEGGGTDANAVHVNAAGEINGITAKASPTASDLLIIEDVADSNNKKKIAIGNLPIGGGGSGTKVLVQGRMDTTQGFTSTAERIDYVDNSTGGFDINNEWDNTTHRFTVAASGAGVYQFTNQIFVDNGGGWVQLYCEKNGVKGRITGTDLHSSWDTPIATTNIELAVGDYVEFFVDSTSSFTMNATWYALNNFQITKLTAVAPTAGTDVNALHTNISGEITALTAKATPTTSDVLVIEDAADSNNKKKSTLASIKNTVAPILTKTLTLEAPTASDDITIFKTDRAITVQEVIAVNVGTSPSTTYQLKYNAARNNAGTALTTSASTTSVVGGNVATLSNASIPADNWVWLETSAASGTDVFLTIDIRYTED